MISSMIMNNSYGACKVTNKHNYSVTYFLLTATLHNFTLLTMDTRQSKKYILLINPKRKQVTNHCYHKPYFSAMVPIWLKKSHDLVNLC